MLFARLFSPLIKRGTLVVVDHDGARHTLGAGAPRYDARFCRMWEFFLAGAEAAFRSGFQMNIQFELCKKLDAVPFTRDYLCRG